VRRPTSATLAAILAAGLLVPLVTVPAPAQAAAAARRIDYRAWDAPAELRSGAQHGLRVTAGSLALDGDVDAGTWTSPWASPGFALTELVASWTARTPGDSSLRVEVRGRTRSTTSSWDTLAVWAAGDRHVRRTTSSGQADDLGSVNVDTWEVPGGVTSYQLRLTRAAGLAVGRRRRGRLLAPARRLRRRDLTARRRPGHRARRAALLADDPRGRLSAVRRRW